MIPYYEEFYVNDLIKKAPNYRYVLIPGDARILYVLERRKIEYTILMPDNCFSDDILIYAERMEEAEAILNLVEQSLSREKLSFHPQKTEIIPAEKKQTFLFMEMEKGNVRLSDSLILQMIKKLKSEAMTLYKKLSLFSASNEMIMRYYIKEINPAFFESRDGRLPFARVLFISGVTSEQLQKIDHRIQDSIRIMGSGKKSNARYRISYQKMRAEGYRSLVGEYYRWRGLKKHFRTTT